MLHSFLGAGKYYCRIIKGFAAIARPLKNMLEAEEPKAFGEPAEEQLKAFETPRDALVNPPVLALSKLGLSIMIDTDASNYQIGVAFLQMAHLNVPK